MVRKKVRSNMIAAGLLLIVVGAALALLSRPIFTLTRDASREVPMSEIIMNSSFDIDQSQDKLTPFQISIGQTLNISAMGTENFNFSIANFTDPSHLAQPDQPDLVYLSLDNITTINTTWSPVVRTAQPGSYYLVFLARNASVNSPVQVMANVTKTWSEIQTYGVPYLGSALDSNFVYVGLGLVTLGGAISLFAFFSRRTFRKHMSSKRTSAGRS